MQLTCSSSVLCQQSATLFKIAALVNGTRVVSNSLYICVQFTKTNLLQHLGLNEATWIPEVMQSTINRIRLKTQTNPTNPQHCSNPTPTHPPSPIYTSHLKIHQSNLPTNSPLYCIRISLFFTSESTPSAPGKHITTCRGGYSRR